MWLRAVCGKVVAGGDWWGPDWWGTARQKEAAANWYNESSLGWLKEKGHGEKLSYWQEMKSSAIARIVDSGETLDSGVARMGVLQSIRLSQTPS